MNANFDLYINYRQKIHYIRLFFIGPYCVYISKGLLSCDQLKEVGNFNYTGVQQCTGKREET